MEIELLKLLLDGGFSAVIIYMVLDMRNEARQQRAETWALLEYLIKRDEPGASIAHIVGHDR